MIISFLRFSFWILIGYTVTYMVLWLAGTGISVFRLSHFEENQERVRDFLRDDLAKTIPVSVIIPAYNEEACICDTVDALLEEDYPSLEILVVDDGSKDRTAELLRRRYGLQPCRAPETAHPLSTHPLHRYDTGTVRGKRLSLGSKENGGKGDALNCGLNLSRSRYCVVVDADTQIRPGSIRVMVSRFLKDRDTVVCAGAVGTCFHNADNYRKLPLHRKILVLFQRIEYYRTFYVQRIFYDKCNANIIVSGAFAMFDRSLVLAAGGYKTDTIGEDMELTMRLHAFCISQHRPYRIAYVPEARCDTQVPVLYRDYFRQRRRWHIGLTQSLARHFYMVGRRYYGWVGVLSVLYTVIYEFLAPIIEIFGLIVLLFSAFLGLYNLQSAIVVFSCYLVLSLMTQSLLFSTLRTYRVDPMTAGTHLKLLLVSASECFFFHPLNLLIKMITFLTYRKYQKSWSHIHRVRETIQNP